MATESTRSPRDLAATLRGSTRGRADRHRHTADVADTDPARAWPKASGSLSAGALVSDRYRVVRLLARGGMSRVYLAEQTGLGRQVVLKTIHRRFLSDPASVASFLQEAKVLASIDHPNTLAVYGVGETTSGELYIAMEFVPGCSLAELVARDGPLPPARAVSLLLQMARALAAAHRRGVIHRDIKPGNVLVQTTASGIEMAKVADFGLAKVSSLGRPRAATGAEGRVLGTPEYMAPEQIRAHGVDRRADLYSLGCVAYEMLTGRPPFQGGRLAVLTAHLHEAPVPLQTACPSARIPPCFQPFIDRALAKRPGDRFDTAFELYAALLQTSDCAGISRRELRLVETLFDDPAYAIVHDGRLEPERPLPQCAPATPRWLVLLVLLVCVFTAGVAAGRCAGVSARDSAPADVTRAP